ncbi:hypothetical protein KK141_05430 [Dyella sp. LX-66]|uniref:hypothetical protein n=1 Tax=unclassified Dyella TaxID=2634549 RepID=UPI001BE05230|nr:MULTISPECIES: hypothetical protein [unclassified Dyella]MBT2116848.1 hypothetical protein [Dyella sp. LX-1]MBT2138972.1 hypothetical protein [Dyella sp. LX-66]
MNTQLPPDNGNDLPDKGRLPGEDELGALYRKLPRKEPGPALDAAVLRAAAQAIRADQPAAASARAPKRPRWPIALSSAAVLVLAAGLGWRMRDMPASVPAAQPGAVTVQEAAKPAAPTVAAAPAPEVQGDVAESPVPLPEKAAPPGIVAARVRQTDGVAAKRAALPASAVRNAPLQEQAALASAPMAATPAPAEPPAPAAAAAELRAYAPKQAEPVAQGYAANQQAADRRAEAAADVMATPAAPPPADDTARNAQDTPAQELDKIRRLLAQRHRDEARQRLADFHRDHPDYTLPDDLRTLLLTP